ncbi:MAG: hypothetical protein V3T77_05000 [Planctomycetota bacterium]
MSKIAEEYRRKAHKLLAQYDQLGDNPASLTDAMRQRLKDEFYGLQLDMEPQFVQLLSAEQLQQLQEHVPKLFTFDDTVNFRGNSEVIGGF